MAQLSVECRMFIRLFITLAHLATIFTVIWFFIGHIWFIPVFFGGEPETSLRVFTMVMVIIQHIVGIWMVSCRVWYKPRVLRWLAQEIVDCLTHLADLDKHDNDNESKTDKKPEYKVQPLIIL